MGVLDAFAPQVEKKLSGAARQDSGSPSVQARTILGQEIAGLNSTALQVVVHVSQGAVATDPQAQTVLSRATTLLKADHRIREVITPQRGFSISQDGRTAILQAGANANTMVRAWAGAWHMRRQGCVTPTVRVAARSNEARCVRRKSPVGHSSSA